MSEAFGLSPPVYASMDGAPRTASYPSSYPTNPTSYPTNPTPYPSNPTPYSTPYPGNFTPYPTNTSMPMPVTGNPAYPYSQGYPQTTIPESVRLDSMRSAVIDKVRSRLDEALQLGNAEIDSMKRVEQDLLTGEKKIQSLITDAQQRQIQAQVSPVSSDVFLYFSLCSRMI